MGGTVGLPDCRSGRGESMRELRTLGQRRTAANEIKGNYGWFFNINTIYIYI